uniref:Uncharacterized protein n=1 Tax=Synechococcus phage QB2 TaxID=3159453 RepID=A0AAU8EJV6_9CAUD
MCITSVGRMLKSVSDTLTLIDVYIVYNQRDPQGSLFVWSIL